jgi:PAS domain S-box-containing protein
MSEIPRHPVDEARLQELKSYNILDSMPETDFDDLTALASAICEVPIALISLVDEKRQWFKSHKGLDAEETPIEQSFCAHAILDTTEIMIVEDARDDSRFKDNPLVTGDPHIVFYAGVPLVNEDGFPLGTLCIIDPRKRAITEAQKTALRTLARQVMDKLELKRKHIALIKANEAFEKSQRALQVLNNQLTESETVLRIATESAELALWSFEPETRKVKLSDRYREMFGFASDQIVSFDDLLTTLDLPYRKTFREAIYQSISKQSDFHLEYRVLFPATNRFHWLKGSGHTLNVKSREHPDGSSLIFLGVVQDITVEKQFSAQLSALVKERTRELKRSNEDLLQFAHVASHDLKEPVRKVKLFANMLETDSYESLSDRSKDSLRKIQRASERMITMIDGVLAYSQLHAHEQAPENIDLNEVITNIRSDLDVVIERKNATIISDELPRIEGASVLIYQLLYNLIGNALKFSREGVPPVISIKSFITESQGRNMVSIAVEDNGIGFNMMYSEDIFNNFTRLNSKDKYEGTGLGLALCRKIAMRHQGSLTARSVLGQGSVFTITLPLLTV